MKITLKILIALSIALLFGCAHSNREAINHQTSAIPDKHFDEVSANQTFQDDGEISEVFKNDSITRARPEAKASESMRRQNPLSFEDALINTSIGEELTGVNPQNGTTYTVRTVREYNSSDGYCRESITSTVIDGNKQRSFVTICRRNNEWHILP